MTGTTIDTFWNAYNAFSEDKLVMFYDQFLKYQRGKNDPLSFFCGNFFWNTEEDFRKN